MRFYTRLSVTLALAAVSMAGASAQPSTSTPQAVIVRFDYRTSDLSPLYALENRLEAALEESKAGEYDGSELAPGGASGELFLYGPSADRIFDVARPILESTDFMRGATARKRYGPAGAQEKEVRIVVRP